MARILVTGSAQGIGAQAARDLNSQGHNVVVHARSEERRQAAAQANPRASAVIIGQFDSLASTRVFADAACEQGKYDAVIHNAALGPRFEDRHDTIDGLEQVFHVNVVTPYLLTCLMPLPSRLIYVGSDAHEYGQFRLDDVNWTARDWDPKQAYADSKLLLTMLAMEVAFRYPTVHVNTVHPGWVQTAMGGPNATKSLSGGADSIVWLATSDDDVARGSGHYIVDREVNTVHPLAHDADARGALVSMLEDITGESLPSTR